MNSKLREALNQLLGLIDNEILVFSDGLDPSEVSNAQYQIDKADEAFSTPPRNCDVGTPEEQHARYDKFCNSQKYCQECPCYSVHSCPSWCALNWAQMPYDEGGVE